MSIFDDCRVVVLLADFAGADAAGKLNIIGGGFQFTGLTEAGQTAPQHIVAIIDVPSKYLGEEFSVGLELNDEEAGRVVQVQSVTGNQEALRIQQVAKVNPPQTQGVYLPQTVPSRVQLVMGFPNGLPLRAGGHYAWQLEIEGKKKPEWTAHFHVLGDPPPPVFGGPDNPPQPGDIPDHEA